MKIRNVRHKGLRLLIEKDQTAGLPAAYVDKIRKILGFLQDMEKVEELQAIPVWRAHQLTGDRKGIWSLFALSTAAVCGFGSPGREDLQLESFETLTNRRYLCH